MRQYPASSCNAAFVVNDLRTWAKAIFVSGLMLTLYYCAEEVPASNLPTPELAQSTCGGCHAFPEPQLLDKATWERAVLPKMKFMLGFRTGVPDSILQQFSEAGLGTQLIDQARLFPTEPTLATADWDRLLAWYLEQAPATLPAATYRSTPDTTLPFRLRLPSLRFSPPGTTLAKVLEPGKLMTADVQKSLVFQWNDQLELVKQAPFPSGAVHLNTEADALWLTGIGNFLASDRPEGFLIRYPNDPALPAQTPLPALRRPVHATFGDLNGDGLRDIVVCEFGKWLGALAWWERTPTGYRRHPLRESAGAVKTFLRDMNADGFTDVVALFAQAREGISIFYNDGTGGFREKSILQFPPSYGSTSFELVDFDGDGDLDILYTAGDNADYHPILKPYHGVYLFRNAGEDRFEPVYFHHLPGAYGAQAVDFDQDGDLDIAAVAYFPDYGQPGSPGFVYLRQDAPLQFSPHTFADHRMGRWLSLDVGDLDGDGDQDIILSSLAMEIADRRYLATQERWLRDGIPFLLLENTLLTKK
ncbi:VCBS repeat-containing protein [Neolewinella lacunae]|uniref:VCBS repeat-containing protein n=1 Tax=Neolewinella lacunae TaxID=1517758 RepID=A0A923T802_9BACT|nr:VCBS repeat-containing protein [Neolewinella lacunae]MBC6995080.1 VCBS repeat-containing protein [Neolewinella lacunae]MDN3635371.1 VCBS repeat-containing protein [Neolewinella lacunae]